MANSSLGDVPSITTQMSEALIVRMGRIERQNETLRRINMILGFGLLASLALGALALSSARAGGSGRTIVAQRLVLQDENGVARGTWELGDDASSVLRIQDRNGLARIRFSVLGTGDPGIALTDARGRTRIVLGLLPEQGGTLAFADAEGNTRVVLGMAPDDGTTLVFVDGTGTTRAGLGVDADGDPSLMLYEDPRAPATAGDTTGRSPN